MGLRIVEAVGVWNIPADCGGGGLLRPPLGDRRQPPHLYVRLLFIE